MDGPYRLDNSHKRDGFECGKSFLDNFIRKYATQAQKKGSSTTYVFTDRDNKVVAYYTLTTGGVAPKEATTSVAHGQLSNLPIPIYLLCCFALDKSLQGKRLSGAVFKEAIRTVLAAARTVDAVALVADAIDEDARNFWLKMGFESSPVDKFKVMLLIKDLRATFGDLM